jgi:hypothetical protein
MHRQTVELANDAHSIRANREALMSTRYNNGSHYENHQRAAELQDNAAHEHLVGEHHGEQGYQTGQESSRQALEHSEKAHSLTQELQQKPTTEHGFITFGHDDIATLAHQLWLERGSPEGSPEEDWSTAVALLRSRRLTS